MPTPKTAVFVVDRRRFVREALRSLLRSAGSGSRRLLRLSVLGLPTVGSAGLLVLTYTAGPERARPTAADAEDDRQIPIVFITATATCRRRCGR